MHPSETEDELSYEADVVVVGSGAAAFSAAITARSHGSEVIMVEKSSSPGGTTARSCGGYWIPNNRFMKQQGLQDSKEDAIRYMARYSYPQLYNPIDSHLGLPENEYNLIATYYDNASETCDFLDRIGALQSTMSIGWSGKPALDFQENMPENKGIRGRLLYPLTPDGKQGDGHELVRQFKSWSKEHKIHLLLRHRVVNICTNSAGEVAGCQAICDRNLLWTIRARRAVIFGSGGFVSNAELMLHFQRGPHFGGCAVPTNTGDFIYMSQKIGAKLGNVAGAFRAQIVLERGLDKAFPANVFHIAGDSVILVNRFGQRVMDEKRNFNDRTMVHFYYDPTRGDWTNMLLFLIYDQRTADLWQGYFPIPKQGEAASHVLSRQTWEELASAIEDRLAALAIRTGGFRLNGQFAPNIRQTITRFNDFAKDGFDADFHRGEFPYDREVSTFPPLITGVRWPMSDQKNVAMYPFLLQGPYYAIILAADILDTNGGPMINCKAQVLDSAGEIIQGLYGAGNCISSPMANVCWGEGGTIGPALTYGYLAGINASKEISKRYEPIMAIKRF
jgi:3-oxosteroid 1-dehydrogenase